MAEGSQQQKTSEREPQTAVAPINTILSAMPTLLALVLFSLSPAMEAHSMNNDEPVSGGQIHALDDAQRSDLARKAEAGDAQAAFRLAQYYTFTQADKVQRTRWLAVAAKAGHATAQYNLASELSSDGEDLDQARHWAAEALQNGYKDADRLLGAIEAARSAVLAPDARAALAAKAEAGDAEAAFRLSRYANYVLQDRSQERRWRKLAAEGGHVVGQHNLTCDLYMNGKDLAEAAHWAAESLKNGNADAGDLLKEIEAVRTKARGPRP